MWGQIHLNYSKACIWSWNLYIFTFFFPKPVHYCNYVKERVIFAGSVAFLCYRDVTSKSMLLKYDVTVSVSINRRLMARFSLILSKSACTLHSFCSQWKVGSKFAVTQNRNLNNTHHCHDNSLLVFKLELVARMILVRRVRPRKLDMNSRTWLFMGYWCWPLRYWPGSRFSSYLRTNGFPWTVP